MVRSGLQEAITSGWDRGDRRTRVRRHSGRAYEGRREYAEDHNAVCCTLCSCYPWPVLGLPPTWYKSLEYRARVVREPRVVLRELGLDLPPSVELRVWDSSSEVRYLVLPERPANTEGMTEAELVALVTRDSMIGVAQVGQPKR